MRCISLTCRKIAWELKPKRSEKYVLRRIVLKHHAARSDRRYTLKLPTASARLLHFLRVERCSIPVHRVGTTPRLTLKNVDSLPIKPATPKKGPSLKCCDLCAKSSESANCYLDILKEFRGLGLAYIFCNLVRF